MEITFVDFVEDAGTSHRVVVFRGNDSDKVIDAARNYLRHTVAQFLKDRETDSGDDRISFGIEVDGTWIALDPMLTEDVNFPFTNWREGFLQWKFRESGDNYTIWVYGDENPYTPVVDIREVS